MPEAHPGAGLWWLVGAALATALLMSRPVLAQGLRSGSAAVTLRVTAPPHLREQGSATARGPGVFDLVTPLSAPGDSWSHVELRLVDAEAEADGTQLFVRDRRGSFVRIGATWAAVPLTSSLVVRAVRAGGEGGNGAEGIRRWRLGVRFVPIDATGKPFELSRVVELPALR